MAAAFLVILCAFILAMCVTAWLGSFFGRRPISRREYRHLRSVMNGKAEMRGER